MGKANHRSRGFTLIAALLLLLLLSGVAVGLMYLVTGQGHVGSNDLEANEAYYGAESGMEKLTADLAALYQLNQAPTPGQITALGNNPPTSAMVNGMNYQENITWQSDPNTGLPVTYNTVISSGVNKDLAAEIIPYTL
jgi:Tfp pilus assembly protein PilX